LDKSIAISTAILFPLSIGLLLLLQYFLPVLLPTVLISYRLSCSYNEHGRFM